MAARATKPTGWMDFEITGSQRGVQEMLSAVDSALSPIGLAAFLHGEVGPWVKQRAANRFASEGDDVTGPWAPLAETTVLIRENYGFPGPGPINHRTGQLEEYITQGSVGVVASQGAGILRYPDNRPTEPGLQEKLKTAQQGKSDPQTVARPVLGLNERDLAEVLTLLAFSIQTEGAIRGAGS